MGHLRIRGTTIPAPRRYPNSSNTSVMFGLFKKDPIKKLEKEHDALLQRAMETQRGGDIKGYAKLMAEAKELEDRIIALRAK